MTIIDYVIIGIVAIALLIGVIKGFSGIFFGFFSVLIALGIAVAATMPLAAALGSTQDTLAQTISEKLSASEEQSLFTYDVYKAKNGETQQYELYMMIPDGENYDVLKFSDALEHMDDGVMGTALSLLSGPLENAILSNLEVGEGQANAAPFSNYLSHVFAKILLRLIIFVVVFIAALIILHVFASLVDKLMDYKAIRAIDKILGMLICTGIAAGVIFGAAFLGYTYLNSDNAIVGYLDQSTIISTVKNSGLGKKVFAGSTTSDENQETTDVEQGDAGEQASTYVRYVNYDL